MQELLPTVAAIDCDDACGTLGLRLQRELGVGIEAPLRGLILVLPLGVVLVPCAKFYIQGGF